MKKLRFFLIAIALMFGMGGKAQDVYDIEGSVCGKIESSGNGSSIGKAKDISKTWAAAYFFFFFK